MLGFDPVAEGDEVRRRTGVLTENAGLDDRLTSRENLVFTARLRGFAPDRRPTAGSTSCSSASAWPTGPTT